MQNVSILLRVVLLGSQGLKDISGNTESLKIISISPFWTEVNLIPRTDVHFINALSQTNWLLRPLHTTGQYKYWIANSRCQWRVAKYDNVVSCSSHLDEFVIPRCWDTRLLYVIESVHNRSKSVTQSSASWMTRESSAINLVIHPIRLDILPISAAVLLSRMTRYPSSPYILRPDAWFHIWKLCEAYIVEVSRCWYHTVNYNVNLCLEHIRLSYFHRSKKKCDNWSYNRPECIVDYSK